MSEMSGTVHVIQPVTSVRPVSRLVPGAPAADSEGGSHDLAVAKAKCAVAEYLRDLGLRDPDVIAKECQRIVTQAQGELPPATAVDETPLCEMAIHLTVKELEHWFAVLAVQSGRPDERERLGSFIAARLPVLLDQFPQALNQTRLPAELVGSLHEDLTPVVPPPRPHRMRRQTLSLVPPAWKRRMSHIHHLLFGRTSQSPGIHAEINSPNSGDLRPSSQGCEATRTANRESQTPDVAKAKRSDSFWRQHARSLLTVLTLASTAFGTWSYFRVIAGNGLSLVDYPLAVLFAILFLWVSFSFWTATLGLIALLRSPRREPLSTVAHSDLDESSRTALVMPIYREDPSSVFAGLRAILQSVREHGSARWFDVFVLSDTTDPDVWLAEERAWAKLLAELPSDSRVFYRHRAKNTSRKAGNIADFCTRWGDHYRYMIVLDADSVMAGETLVEMVRRMERHPEIGILQVPPRPVNRQSFFARMQQFAASVYAPVFLEGFVLWSQRDSNYWGHNAIIRIQPFLEHCDLPILPGAGPLGGEILSHDFVEAALMRRAGWKVCLAHDLGGSYEECPTTMLDYAQRDQRWCQGNLQHTKLLLAEGLHPASRLHMGMGVMSYLTSPLWLLFLVLSVLGAAVRGGGFAAGVSVSGGATLFAVTMAMLLLPKLWGLMVLAREPQRAAGHGSWQGVVASLLVETVASVLMAPIMMLLHTHFVVSTVLGHKVNWNTQSRDDRRVSLRDAFAVHYPHTLFGLIVGFLVWRLAPGLLPWMSLVLIGPVLSIPLSMLLGSVKVGQRLARWGLLLIPEEIKRPAVLQWQREALAGAPPAGPSLFVSVLYDPAFYALHVGILRATDSHVPVPDEQVQSVWEALLNARPESIPPEIRRAVLNDAHALETLHNRLRSQLSPTRSVLLS